MPSNLAVHTLGGLAIRIDDAEPHFATRSMPALFVYLACAQRPVARDVLAELIWPDRSQEQARTNLRTAVHRLRQDLDPYLQVTRHTIGVDLAAGAALDVADFEAALAAGDLRQATNLYHGDFLDGFYLDGSPAFEQWALLERERLRSLALNAYQLLIAQEAAAGRIDDAIAAAQRLLQLDPLHEPAHRQLMRLFLLAGRRSAALAQYELCCALLQRELAVPPDAASTALYHEIREAPAELSAQAPPTQTVQLPVPGAGALDGRSLPADGKIRNLPYQLTPFVGREGELALVANLLGNPDCRLLSLLGMGGVGKTRLAVEAAARLSGEFADGVCFVPLAPVAAAEFVLGAIAHSLSLAAVDRDLFAQVAAYVRPRRLLLILDNFEHLLDAADLVASLLRQAPGLKILVTTRVRLQLTEEWLLPLEGFSVGDSLLNPAAQLFIRSAKRVQPNFSAREQAAAIIAICRQAEGLPLAIELAASWVRLMTCDAIAAELRRGLDVLATSLHDVPQRHRSARALLDHSWRLLSPPERSTLAALSVFSGGWRLEEAQAVVGGGDRANLQALLLGLVNKSLVRSMGARGSGGSNDGTMGGGRCDLHELVRQFAAEKLAAEDRQEEVRQRHYAAYLAFARAADGKLRGPHAGAWFRCVDAEQDNLRGALQWAHAGGRHQDMAWLAIAAIWYWARRGQWQEAAGWFTAALDGAAAWTHDLRVACLCARCSVEVNVNPPEAVSRSAMELVELARSCENPLLLPTALLMRALSALDPPAAEAACVEALACLDRVQDAVPLPEFCLYSNKEHLRAHLLSRYGSLLSRRGAYAEAKRHLETCLAIERAEGNPDTVAEPLGRLGQLTLIEGDMPGARAHLHAAYAAARSSGNAMSLATWQPLYAKLLLYEGDCAAALELAREGLAFGQTMHDAVSLAKATTVLAAAALQCGELDAAVQALAAARQHFAYARFARPELVDYLYVAARLAAAERRYGQAAALFGVAHRLRDEIRHRLDAPMRPLVDGALEEVRCAMAPAAFAEAWRLGEQMPLEQALAALS